MINITRYLGFQTEFKKVAYQLIELTTRCLLFLEVFIINILIMQAKSDIN